jgi:predicted Rossmann fold nucleotide-binding protein DprA/Smf involved in DNA uptake
MLVADLNDLFERLKPLKERKGILWFGVSGSWRQTNGEIERSVRRAVKKIIANGGGIVSGGALNVDYFATDEAMRSNDTADRIKIFLPVTLDLYADHYRKRADEGVITSRQANDLIIQLQELKKRNPGSLIENKNNKIVDNRAYLERNSEVVNASDALIVFRVNESQGTGDAIKKALDAGKDVYLEEYTITDKL